MISIYGRVILGPPMKQWLLAVIRTFTTPNLAINIQVFRHELITRLTTQLGSPGLVLFV